MAMVYAFSSSPRFYSNRSACLFITSSSSSSSSSIPREERQSLKMVSECGIKHRQRYHGITHSLAPEKAQVFKSLERWAEMEILPYLKPVEKCWQPQDLIPVPWEEGFVERVEELRRRALSLPDEYLVVLIGDMITEEALPTYHTILNSLDGTRDESGFDPSSWARWTRGWSAEENRHGDVLNKYLYLTSRVNMRQLEKTIQYLISSGMESQFENNPYMGFIYTSFQERATFISHGNTARLAKEHGDTTLAKICGMIASDEKRHENAYIKIVEKLFTIDPDGMILAFENMMRKRIAMPAHLMYDGETESLFDNFSHVAQRIGVYTTKDYASILQMLIKRWNVEKLVGMSGQANQAQDFLCRLPERILKLEERAQQRKSKRGPNTIKFSWIFNREVVL